jgi:hypothetical protein
MSGPPSNEGETFGSLFAGLFSGLSSNANANAAAAATDARLQAERRAGMTPRQRARRAVRTAQVNFRADPAIKAVAEAIADKLNCSVADVMERAILDLAKKEKVQHP